MACPHRVMSRIWLGEPGILAAADRLRLGGEEDKEEMKEGELEKGK